MATFSSNPQPSSPFLLLCLCLLLYYILKNIPVTLAGGEGLFVFVFVVCTTCFCALYKARLVRLLLQENEDKSSD